MFKMIEVRQAISVTWILPVRVIKKPQILARPKKSLGLNKNMDDHTQEWHDDE